MGLSATCTSGFGEKCESSGGPESQSCRISGMASLRPLFVAADAACVACAAAELVAWIALEQAEEAAEVASWEAPLSTRRVGRQG